MSSALTLLFNYLCWSISIIVQVICNTPTIHIVSLISFHVKENEEEEKNKTFFLVFLSICKFFFGENVSCVFGDGNEAKSNEDWQIGENSESIKFCG